MYLIAIVYLNDIHSLRDLKPKDQPWLKMLMRKIKAVISTKYSVHPDELRIYIHYQPSHYHFHIHIMNILNPGLGFSIATGKAILLDEVIEQLNYMGGEGYERSTLYYVLGKNHELWKRGLNKVVEKQLETEGTSNIPPQDK